MRTEHLKFFIALAKNGSRSKTALEFYTTHQNVSKMIRQLEDEMNAPLFNRSHKGMTLTPQGELFLSVALETMQAFHQVRLEMAYLNRCQDLEGTITLSSTPVAASLVLQKLIEDFNLLYPKVNYKIIESNPLDLLQYVAFHQGHLGMAPIMLDKRYRHIYAPYLQQVQLYSLFEDEYFCLVSPHSDLAKEKKISLTDFAKHPIALLQSAQAEQINPLTQLLQQFGGSKPTLVTPSRTLYTQSIASGRFVGVTTRHLGRTFEGTLTADNVFIPFEEDLRFHVMLITNKKAKFDEVTQKFVEMIKEHQRLCD